MNGPPGNQASPFQSPRQLRVYNRLHNLLGLGPGATYYDACRHRIESPPHNTALSQISHLNREIEGSLLDVLAPKHIFKSTGSDDHAMRIEAAGALLGLDPQDELLELWKQLKWHATAHRKNLSVRSLDPEFEEKCLRFDALLDTVLSRFADQFVVCIRRVNDLRAVSSPGKSNVTSLRTGIPNHHSMYEVFFKPGLSDRWFEALKNDFFGDPPENAISSIIDFGITQSSEKPKQAIVIARQLPVLTDLDALRRFIALLRSIDPEECVPLIPKVLDSLTRVGQLSTSFESMLVVPIQNLITHLGNASDSTDTIASLINFIMSPLADDASASVDN